MILCLFTFFFFRLQGSVAAVFVACVVVSVWPVASGTFGWFSTAELPRIAWFGSDEPNMTLPKVCGVMGPLAADGLADDGNGTLLEEDVKGFPAPLDSANTAGQVSRFID